MTNDENPALQEGLVIQLYKCTCGTYEHTFDYSEFGLPLGCDRHCTLCGAIWNSHEQS